MTGVQSGPFTIFTGLSYKRETSQHEVENRATILLAVDTPQSLLMHLQASISIFRPLPQRFHCSTCQFVGRSEKERHRSTTSARYFQKGYVGRIYRAWNLFLILSMCSSNVHLADTRPHSPTTLAYDPHKHHWKHPNYAPAWLYGFFAFRHFPMTL